MNVKSWFSGYNSIHVVSVTDSKKEWTEDHLTATEFQMLISLFFLYKSGHKTILGKSWLIVWDMTVYSEQYNYHD